MIKQKIDAEDIATIDANDEQVQQDLALAERVSWYFINNGHIECSLVMDAFYEGGMDDMLAAALNNGRQIRNICRQAFNHAGATVLFGKTESEHQKRERLKKETRRLRRMCPQSLRQMRSRRDRALADLVNLTGDARTEFVRLQFGGKEPSIQQVTEAIDRLKPKLRPTIVFPEKMTTEQPIKKAS